MFFAEVEDSMKVSQGGGLAEEVKNLFFVNHFFIYRMSVTLMQTINSVAFRIEKCIYY